MEPSKQVHFDEFAGDYDAALQQGLSASGESKDYFAEGRCRWLWKRLAKLDFRPERMMDFGCGTGSATPHFLRWPGLRMLIGTDVSPRSIEVASKEHGCDRARFFVMDQYTPNEALDLVFCNGVFHHIPLDQRAEAMEYIYYSLRPGGVFALWENNPWNPGTRYVMSRIPFDRDAITLSPPYAKRMVKASGFEVLGRDFLFIFPRRLKWLRPMERALVKLPLGAQYLVLGWKQ